MKMLSILFVLTSHGSLENTNISTGTWLANFAEPYYEIVDDGFKVDIVSIKGGNAPIDPESKKDKNNRFIKRFLKDSKLQQSLKTTSALNSVYYGDYDAVIIPGGAGSLYDMTYNKELAIFIENANQRGIIIATIAEGVAAFVSTQDERGKPLVLGRSITGISRGEYKDFGSSNSPLDVGYFFQSQGVKYESMQAYKSFAIIDSNIITGQNSNSVPEVTELLLHVLHVMDKEVTAACSEENVNIRNLNLAYSGYYKKRCKQN